jgi:hypothetical protein
MRHHRVLAVLMVAAGAHMAQSCGSVVAAPDPTGESGSGHGASGGGGASSVASGAASGNGAAGVGGFTGAGGGCDVPACVQHPCSGGTYACGDCADNDGDGRIDMDDPECLTPCATDEATIHHVWAGDDPMLCKSDCFFDAASGSGDDKCLWDHRCDPLEVPPDYFPEGPDCPYPHPNPENCAAPQQQACRDFCVPLTPNGCDCFGCCELPPRTGKFVWLGAPVGGPTTCTIALAGDPTKCAPCTPVPSCENACEPCEKCLGDTGVPPDCGQQACPPSAEPCGELCQTACPAGKYCSSGCCVQSPYE